MTAPQPRPGRKARDCAALLPVCGVLLWFTPLFGILSDGGLVLGVPVLFLYVFGVWLGLILLARALSLRLSSGPAGATGTAEATGPADES